MAARLQNLEIRLGLPLRGEVEMQSHNLLFLGAVVMLAVVFTSCAAASEEPAGMPTSSPTHIPTATAVLPTEPLPSPATDFAGSQEDFRSDGFDRPTDVANKYFPLKPTTQYVYEGFTREADKSIPHSIVYTVTDLTKEIAGVRTVVMDTGLHRRESRESRDLVLCSGQGRQSLVRGGIPGGV
jgi:hypothetical protein